MKAVLLHGYGGVDQLHYEDAPEPVPAQARSWCACSRPVLIPSTTKSARA
jgi:hypothetical protein